MAFDYLKSGAAEPERRVLEPWGVLSWRRRWYVAGLDRGRGEPRSFRLSRVTGTVRKQGGPGAFTRPEHVDLLDMVAGHSWDDSRTARIEVTASGAGQLRRIADSERDGVLSVTFSDTNWLARLVAGAGAGARVLEPPDLADAVIGLLTAVADGAP